MNTAPNPTGHLDIGGVFRRAGDIYKQSFVTIWLLALAIAIPVAIIRGLLSLPEDGFIAWLFGVLAWILGVVGSVWIAGSIVKVVQDIESDGQLDAGVGEIIGSVAPKLVPLFFLAIVYAVLVTIGFAILIVPGLILAVLWVVAIPAMVVEDEGVFGSLGRSTELTKGNRWRIVGLAILVLILELVVFGIAFGLAKLTLAAGVIAGVVAALVLFPYLASLRSVLYFRLVESQGGAAVPGGGLTGGVEEADAVEVVEEVDTEERP